MAREYHSKNRDFIIQYFESHTDSKVRAAELHREMTAAGCGVNLTTVYRNLDKLTRENILSAHQLSGEEEKFYQYMRPRMECAHHLHLVCSRCGRIIHLNCDFMKEISDHLMADHGFALDCGGSMLTGLCSECSSKTASPCSEGDCETAGFCCEGDCETAGKEEE